MTLTKEQLEKILRKRVLRRCEGTVKVDRKDKQCLLNAHVGSIFCEYHGGNTTPRYISPKDLPNLIEEIYESISVSA